MMIVVDEIVAELRRVFAAGRRRRYEQAVRTAAHRVVSVAWVMIQIAAVLFGVVAVLFGMLFVATAVYLAMYWVLIPTEMHSVPVFLRFDSAPPFEAIGGQPLLSVHRSRRIRDEELGSEPRRVRRQPDVVPFTLVHLSDATERHHFLASSSNVVAWASSNMLGKQWTLSNYALKHLAVARRHNKQSFVLDAEQEYDVDLEVSVPESVANRDIGTAMIHIDMMCRPVPHQRESETSFGRKTIARDTAMEARDMLVASSSRAMQVSRHDSAMLRFTREIVYTLPMALGWMRSTYTTRLSMIEGYVEDSTCRTSRVNITVAVPLQPGRDGLRAHAIDVHDAKLHFRTQLRGLRYLMHRWFFSTAAVAILGLFFAQLAFCVVVGAVLAKLYSVGSEGLNPAHAIDQSVSDTDSDSDGNERKEGGEEYGKVRIDFGGGGSENDEEEEDENKKCTPMEKSADSPHNAQRDESAGRRKRGGEDDDGGNEEKSNDKRNMKCGSGVAAGRAEAKHNAPEPPLSREPQVVRRPESDAEHFLPHDSESAHDLESEHGRADDSENENSSSSSSSSNSSVGNENGESRGASNCDAGLRRRRLANS